MALERYRRFTARLDAIAAEKQTRRLQIAVPIGPTTVSVNGTELIVACSNDYLGLAHHPDVVRAATGRAAGASRLLGGTRPAHEALERELEEWLGRPALLFASGYHANLAVFSTLCEPGDLVASDAANHASIIDGIRLSRATRRIVAHADPSSVPGDARLVALEGLYSMDGDIPPFLEYPRAPWLAVDEAHAIGCLGPCGRGAAAAAGVEPDILIGTLGKALGAAGAFVVGPPESKELLINCGRSFIFTTASPEYVVQSARAALRIAIRGDDLREQLASRTKRFRDALAALGWRALGAAHIVPVFIGRNVMDVSDRLLKRGILAPGIRFPTVPRGSERIRFTLSAAHTNEQIDRIAEALGPAPSS